MDKNPSSIAFGLIIMGAFFSLGREYLAKFYLKLHGWLRKKEAEPRMQKGVEIYFMFTGMFFTVLGLLGLLKVIPM